MCHGMARLGFVPNFAAGPQSHVGEAVLALSLAQVRGPSGLARVLPGRDGIVHAGSGARAVAIKFLSSLPVATAVV